MEAETPTQEQNTSSVTTEQIVEKVTTTGIPTESRGSTTTKIIPVPIPVPTKETSTTGSSRSIEAAASVKTLPITATEMSTTLPITTATIQLIAETTKPPTHSGIQDKIDKFQNKLM